ncbi:MAG: A/G-specific adenine glycosylase [Actinomycetota bacterium]
MTGAAVSDALRAWYRPRRRAYPWRGSGDPYAVLVSEVMLQQTQAARAVPVFERFLARFPTVDALASAPRSEVVRAWAGLGYNRRAVALSEAAREIERAHGGRIPGDPEVLRTLPGVGPYTAAAVASFAFGAPVPALDTNVRRVVARARLGRDPDDVAVGEITAAADAWIDRADPGAWNQGLMDLGREVCRAKPRCDACPVATGCRFLADGVSPRAPRRRQGPFAGSTRQVRGAVVDVLRERPSATLATLVARTGFEPHRIHHAVATLHAEGMLVARPAALDGRPSGVVRLAT